MIKFKRIITILAIAFIAAIITISCSRQKQKECLIIPKDALFVCDVKLGSLLKKSDIANIDKLKSVSELRNELKEDEPYLDDLLESVMKDPSITGVNVKEDMLFFGYKEGKNQVYVIALTMSNKANFEEFLRKISKASGSSNSIKPYTDSKNNLTYIDFGDEAIASYNDERVLFVVPERHAKTETLQRYAADLFNLEEGKCITSLPTFNDYWSNRGDVSVFYSYKTVFADYSPGDVQRMAGFLPEDVITSFENMAMSFSLAFENEGVNLLWSAYGLHESMKKIVDKNFNKDLIKYMPEKTYIAGSFACNIDGIIEFFEKSGGKDNPMDEKIGIKDFTVKDLLNAFGGSFAASFFGMVDDEIPAVAIAADITNLNIITNIIEQVGFTKNGDLFTIPSLPFALCIKGNVIIASTDMSVLNKDIEGGYSNGLGNIADKAKDGNYVYVNLDYDRYPSEIKKIIDDDVFTYHDYDYDYYTDSYEELTYHDDEAARAFTEIMRWFRNADVKLDNNGLVVKVYTSDNNSNSLSFIINKINDLASRQLK